MGWLPFATAVVLCALVVGLYAVHRNWQRSGARVYRQKFLQSVMQLDTVTRGVNDLGANIRQIKDAKVLEYYEGTLRLLETLLGVIRKVEPFGTNPAALNSAMFLIRDLRERVGRLERAFKDVLSGRSTNLSMLYGTAPAEGAPLVTGCYFCSRPVISERFSEVRVRLDGQVREVMGCKICRDELADSQKVKVLHFMQDGQPVHWSKVDDYKPNEDFWNINKRDQVVTKRRLELVPSVTEAIQPE